MKRFKWAKHLGYESLDTNKFVEEINETYYIIEYSAQTAYFCKGEWHREDGPARIFYRNGDKIEIDLVEYWLKGKRYRKDEWFEKISKLNRIKYLFNLDKYHDVRKRPF